MLKFNNYPPKEVGDVEFTKDFMFTHRTFDPFKMGRLVTHSLLDNMQIEDQPNAPVILADLIGTFPERSPSSQHIYSSTSGRMLPYQRFVSSIEAELGQSLPIGAEV